MLLDGFRKENLFVPYINTGTLFDLATGKFRQGTNGGWVLDGGIPPCLGISGRSQTYKSGLAGSFFARALDIHRTSEGYVFETEGNIAGAERYDDFVSIDSPVSSRILFKNLTTTNLTDFYDEFGKLAEEKIKRQKEFMVDSPFINPQTGKPHKCWIPTFVLVDSFSRARSNKSEEQYDDNKIDDASMNTSYLLDGNIKTRIMSDLPARAAKAGIYTIMTAHVGNKFDLNPYAPSAKQLQYMKNTDKMKSVGSNFEFLTTTLIQTLKAQVLQDKDKKCEYPASFSTDVEVNQVDTMMVRCKNNAAGVGLSFVVSQFQGILDSVTNFVLLKNYKNFGMEVQGNNQAFGPLIRPEQKFTKKTIRELTDKDYGMYRALELIAQLCFIQNLWSTWRMPEFVRMPVTKFAELLKNSQKCSIDRVLQSTSVWSTSQQERERLTILDILQFLAAEEKK